MTWLYWILIAALLWLAWNRHRALVRSRQAAAESAARVQSQHLSAIDEEIRQRDALYDAMREGVLLLDENQHVIRANRALRGAFSIEGDPTGQSAIALLRSAPQIPALLRRAIDLGEVADAEIDLPRLGAASRYFQVNIARLSGPDGRTHRTLLVFHDITGLKQIEMARTDFVANVSHELRTPLAIVKSYAETLAASAVALEETPRFAAIIERHADRLTSLVDDLLTLSGMESGQLAIEPQPVDAASIAAAAIEELNPRAAARQITIRNQIAPGSCILADPSRLRQALFNLVDNAIKYGREGGSVTVAADETDGGMILSVADDGPGIPPAARDRIFERFYRLDRARSREQGGTGLGLAIVKHIVLAHGGRAWVEAVETGGARFCLSLARCG